MWSILYACPNIILLAISVRIPFVVLQLFPSCITDLSFGSPLIMLGRYKGDFPDTIKVKGRLADMSTFIMDLKVQNAKDKSFDRVIFLLLKLIPLEVSEFYFHKEQLTSTYKETFLLMQKLHLLSACNMSALISICLCQFLHVLLRSACNNFGPCGSCFFA